MGMSVPLVYECQQSRQCAEEYVVEAIDYASEGEIYAATFSGHGAKERAEEYAAWKNAAALDFAGQIASLKDHLRLSGTRLNAAEDILRSLVDEWDETGQIGKTVIEDARAHLDMAPPSAQSPITDAAIDAAKPKPWNACPKCKNLVDIDDEGFDGSEVRCHDCGVMLVVSEYGDGAFALNVQDAHDLPDPEDAADAASVVEADPLAGLPEAERLRIIGAATAAGIAARDACMAESQDADAARSAYGPAHHAALVREVAAYRAQKSAAEREPK